MTKKTSTIPIPVIKALVVIGSNIKEARLKRRLTMKLVAERAGIKTDTLSKIEKGSSSVSIGIYAKVIFVLGLINDLYKLANPDNDDVGKALAAGNLPKRIRNKNMQNGN